MTDPVGAARARRRFSELLDRVGAGERIVIVRRGEPAAVLVPLEEHLTERDHQAGTGFAALAGALSDWDEFDDIVENVCTARRRARDRAAPDLT